MALLLLQSFSALAAPPGLPIDLGSPMSYARAGQCTQGHLVYVDSAYTNVVLTSTGALSDSNRPLLVPFGSLVSLTCDADVIACFVADDDATITSTVGVLRDTGSTSGETTGIGGCLKIEASSYRNQTLWKSAASPSGVYADHGQLSVRTKSCGSTTAAKDTALDGYPCDATTDCFYSATTCTTDNGRIGGSFLIARGTADTSCWFCLER